MTRLATSMARIIYSVRSVLGTVDECDLSSQLGKPAIGHVVAVGGERLLLIGRWPMAGTSRPGEQCYSRPAVRFRNVDGSSLLSLRSSKVPKKTWKYGPIYRYLKREFMKS